jgi:hypothetical protein
MININIAKSLENKISEEEANLFYDFTQYCITKLNISGDVTIMLKGKKKVNGITTGSFNTVSGVIYARCEDRAPVDVLRTISHELMHQKQLETGAITYALNNDGLPDIGGPIEDEANAMAGRLIKMYVRDKEARYLYEL